MYLEYPYCHLAVTHEGANGLVGFQHYHHQLIQTLGTVDDAPYGFFTIKHSLEQFCNNLFSRLLTAEDQTAAHCTWFVGEN